MEHQDKKLEIWREAIPRMNEEDLEFILDFPECFEPKVLRMVKRRYIAPMILMRMETFILNTKMKISILLLTIIINSSKYGIVGGSGLT